MWAACFQLWALDKNCELCVLGAHTQPGYLKRHLRVAQAYAVLRSPTQMQLHTWLYCHQGQFQALGAVLPGPAISISAVSHLSLPATAGFHRAIKLPQSHLPQHCCFGGETGSGTLAVYALLWHVTKANPSSRGTGQNHAENPVQALRAASMRPALGWNE